MSQAFLAGVGDWLLYIISCVAGICLSIVLHEFGHVIGAYLTRSRIFEIALGSKARMETWVGGTRLRISVFPLEGYVIAVPRSLTLYRLRRLITIGLGPAFSVCYLAALFWLSSALMDSSHRSFDSVVTLLMCIELAGLGRTLWPYQVVVNGMRTGTDMLQLWWTLTRPLPQPEEHERQFAYAEAASLRARGKSEELQEWIRKILTRLSRMTVEERGQWASLLLGLEQWQAAQDVAETILSDPKCEQENPCRAEAADTFACAVLYGDVRDTMPKALGILRDAITLFPDMITLKGSLGGLLFGLRQLDEAEAVLNEVIHRSSADIDHGISSAFLARIAEGRGQIDEAKKLAQIARQRAGEMTIVKRVLEGFPQNAGAV